MSENAQTDVYRNCIGATERDAADGPRLELLSLRRQGFRDDSAKRRERRRQGGAGSRQRL
jgi:hypothetical protein